MMIITITVLRLTHLPSFLWTHLMRLLGTLFLSRLHTLLHFFCRSVVARTAASLTPKSALMRELSGLLIGAEKETERTMAKMAKKKKFLKAMFGDKNSNRGVTC